MKKFMKVTAIVGGVFLLVGLIVLGVGALGGGIRDLYRQYIVVKTVTEIAQNFDLEESVSTIEGIVEKLENDEMANVEDIEELTDALGISEMEDVQEITDFLNSLEELETGDMAEFLDKFGIDISIDGAVGSDIFEDEYPIYSEGTYIFEDISAKDLEIEVGNASLIIKQHNEPHIKLEVGTENKAQCFVEDGELHVFAARDVLISVGDTREVTLYLPKEMIFEEMTGEVGAGNLEFYDIWTTNAEIEVGAGNMVADDFMCNNLSLEAGLGSVEIEGQIDGDITVDCGMGAVSMKLVGEATDYNYAMDCGMGAIDVDGIYSVAGIGSEQNHNNNASKNVKIDCGMGSVEITFDK